MRRVALATLLLLTVLLPMTRCFPSAAWSTDGYYADVSHSTSESSILGHCFRMRYDADIRSFETRIKLNDGGVVDVGGSIHIITPGTSPPDGVKIPKGSQVVVEKVVKWQNVGNSFLKAYARVDGVLVETNGLFEIDSNGKGLTYTPRLLEPCD